MAKSIRKPELEITDTKHYELLEEFANGHSIAIGGNIKVNCSPCSTSLKPYDELKGCKIEDANYLNDQIKGADSFLFWLRRKGYIITKNKGNK